MVKFADIPQYTQGGYYRTDVSLEDVGRHIQRYINEYGLDVQPDFQRAHVWGDDKRIAYVEHLLKGGVGSNEFKFNHPGWMGDWKGSFELVDGLQRLTAIQMFLSNSLPVFKQYTYNDFDDILGFHVAMSFRVNDLKTRREVLQWYLEINTGGVVHTLEEIAHVERLLAEEQMVGRSQGGA